LLRPLKIRFRDLHQPAEYLSVLVCFAFQLLKLSFKALVLGLEGDNGLGHRVHLGVKHFHNLHRCKGDELFADLVDGLQHISNPIYYSFVDPGPKGGGELTENVKSTLRVVLALVRTFDRPECLQFPLPYLG